MKSEQGFTLIEVLVTMVLVSVIGAAALTFMMDAFGRLSLEARAAENAQEVQNALKLLSSELRMSRSISPYLPGINPDSVNCSTRISVDSDSVSFLVPHENSSSSTGISVYYVGYYYDALNHRLYRGSVAGSGSTCVLPGTDPLAPEVAQLLAENISQIDADNNGTLDPVFSISGNRVNIRVGVQTTGRSGMQVTQQLATDVRIRAG